MVISNSVVASVRSPAKALPVSRKQAKLKQVVKVPILVDFSFIVFVLPSLFPASERAVCGELVAKDYHRANAMQTKNLGEVEAM